jgi:hypothetical protein
LRRPMKARGVGQIFEPVQCHVDAVLRRRPCRPLPGTLGVDALEQLAAGTDEVLVGAGAGGLESLTQTSLVGVGGALDRLDPPLGVGSSLEAPQDERPGPPQPSLIASLGPL